MPITRYIYSTKPSFRETYLLVRFLGYALRPQKSCSYIRWEEPHSLWRSLSSSSFLQTDTITFSSVSESKISSAQQSLQYRRGDVSIDLSNCTWHWPHRNIAPIKIQWCFPISHWIIHISKSNDLTTLSFADGALSAYKTQKTPRQIALDHDPKTQASNTNYLRSGLYSPCPVRQTGDGSHRLQSHKARQTLLSSPSMFQRYHQRLLAWRASPWRYSYIHRNYRTVRRILFPITSLSKKCNYPSRQGILRPQDCGISGIQENPLCHCCKAYKAHKEKTFRSILQGIFIRYRDRRVYVSTNGLEKGIPFCSDTASYSRRPHRAAYPFLDGQIQLPDYCNKYEAQSSQYLEVLQWPSIRRTYYQRTKGELPLSKDPDETFCSQRGLFSHPSFFLQSHKLVQTAMSTRGVPEYDT